MTAHDYAGAPLTLATGQVHRVKLPPRIMRGRLTGFLFDTNKTFLLPAALTGIRGLASFYAAHPGLKVLVTGHTDTVGSTTANLALSDERAQAIAAFLSEDVDVWLRHYRGTPASSIWATREDQHMLTALPDGQPPYFAGPVTGVLDAPTRAAVQRFQGDHGLAVDGVPGDATRRALVIDYMAIAGTSLPPGTELATHGCGEYHPAVPTADETAEQANRRVEVFFFEGPIEPAPQPRCPAPGCPEYPVWLEQTILTIDFTNPPPKLSNARWENVDDDEIVLRTRLLDWQGAPCAARSVTVMVDGKAYFGVSDRAGIAAVPVPKGTTSATIRYQPGAVPQLVELAATLEVPALDSDAGVRARLKNLGYPADTDLGYALRAFQLQFALPLTGVADPATLDRLRDVHDHGGAA
jgi:outer membrane protein OmpA-like peptidoglycan-associated protein